METPCQCCLSVEDNFVWGHNLVNTQFKPLQPIFLLTLRMDENGAFYSTDPDQFEVKETNDLLGFVNRPLLESAAKTLR